MIKNAEKYLINRKCQICKSGFNFEDLKEQNFEIVKKKFYKCYHKTCIYRKVEK